MTLHPALGLEIENQISSTTRFVLPASSEVYISKVVEGVSCVMEAMEVLLYIIEPAEAVCCTLRE
jgi:hypothetical protein